MAMDPKAQGAALLEKLRRYEAAADPGLVLSEPRGKAGSEAAQFPARYIEPDERDDYMYVKDKLASTARPAPVTDEDVSSILRKRAQFEVAKQEDWFQNSWSFNSSDPNKQRWAQTVFPEYFARREQVIDEQTVLQNQLAKIKLRGPRSREDIDLLYAIDMGLVDPSNTAIWNLTGDNMNAAFTRRRGVFSPRRIKIGEDRANMRPLQNPLRNFPFTGPNAPVGTFDGQGTINAPIGPASLRGLAGYQ
jgi:hypothetical protein